MTAAGAQVDQPVDAAREEETTKWAQTLGSSPSSGSGTSGAKVLKTAAALPATATCSTITRGWRSLQVRSP